MSTEIRELEGTWEEIMEHAEELAGRRVRVMVFPVKAVHRRVLLKDPQPRP